jgi:hypothetical protein
MIWRAENRRGPVFYSIMALLYRQDKDKWTVMTSCACLTPGRFGQN